MLLADTVPVEVYNEPSLLQVVLIYFGIPALVIVIVVLLVSAPGWTRKGRATQPGKTWDGDSLLVGGAPESVAAVAGADAADATESTKPGGSSATW